MPNTGNYSRQLPVDGNNDNALCKTCGKIDLERDDSASEVHWVTCDKCSEWEHQKCAGINPPRMNISKYVCATCKRQQWTTSDSERMWRYIERTVDGFIGKEGKASWFNNMKKEIGGPYSDSTFKRHFKKELMDYVSDRTKDLKKRIKYAICLGTTCSLEVIKEFKRHGDVSFTERGKILAFTENGSTEPLFAVKNWKKNQSVVKVMASVPRPIPKVDTLRPTAMIPIPQSSTDRILALIGAAIQNHAEENQEEGSEERKGEVVDATKNPLNGVSTTTVRNEVDQVDNRVTCSTSSARYSVLPLTQGLNSSEKRHELNEQITGSSPPQTYSIDGQSVDRNNDRNTYKMEENKLGATSSSAMMISDDQQAPVDRTRGTATAFIQETGNLKLEAGGISNGECPSDEIPPVTSHMDLDQLKFSAIIDDRTKWDSIEVPSPLSAPTHTTVATQKLGNKRGHNIKIKKEEEEVHVKRAKADELKQSLLASSRTRSPPPDTTVGNYLQDLVSFLRKLNRRNKKLEEFIEVMDDVVNGSNKRKQKMSYFDIMSAAKRLFNSFKNNTVIFENNTGEVTCCYDKTYYFELKAFLVLFKKFVSNYDTMLDEFGQLQADIEEEIQRCEREEREGKQELLKIEEIIDRVTSDFDQFGLMKEYKAEVEKRMGSCSSNAR
ncbi:unnamed protein product [Caenorhabditis brenneri]